MLRENAEQLSIYRDGLDLSYLKEDADKIQSECRDYTTMANHPPIFTNMTLNFSSVDNDGRKQLKMSDYAFSQLCTKVGVPVRYMKKCLSDGRLGLVEENINDWLQDYNKPLFLREHDNQLRGILSDKFSVLDTPDIIDSIYRTIDVDDYSVKSGLVTPERFHARLIQNDMLEIDGEKLQAGLQIDSSDVGRKVLTVRFMIYKEVCTNGLVIQKAGGMLFEQKHIGITNEAFYSQLNQAMDLVPSVLENSIDLITGAKDTELTLSRTTKLVEDTASKLKMPEDIPTEVIQLINSNYDRSLWGVVNGFTEIAQNYTLDRRLEIEQEAGRLLSLVA